jgi:hypothetical protein
MPVSELVTLAHPDMFPSPPTPASRVDDVPDSSMPSVLTPLSSPSFSQTYQTQTSMSLREAEEQSWFYYLSEIALRRIKNRVLHYFYKEENTSWSKMNVFESAIIVEDMELQLRNWYALL